MLNPARWPRITFVYATIALLGIVALFGPAVIGQQSAPATAIPHADMQACLNCHQADMSDKVHAVNFAALKVSPHKDLKCQDCHTSMTSAPHTPAMLKTKASCASCHDAEGSAYATSVHSRPDVVPGDHPTCIICHGGGDPHAIKNSVTAPGAFTRVDKAKLCSTCHSDKARMARYGVDPDAVPSYQESFHGKALLRFHMGNAATCTDCHHAHDVLSPNNSAAPTNRAHAAATCASCHKGANVNFAMSGANHLRLKVKQSLILRLEEFFFKWLTAGTIIFLLGGIALDLRRRALGRGPAPNAGRPVALLVSISFLFLVLGLLMAWLGLGKPILAVAAAVGVMALAFIVYFVTPKAHKPHSAQRMFPRLTVAQRWQHALLFTSFTLLVLTGLPIRFYGVDWLRNLYLMMGGLGVLRIVHRVAASIMIFAWIWHTIFLLYRWKKAGFSLKSWTMFPRWKDVTDFIGLSLYYLGVADEEPKYDRFEFRQKFDYFAVYWGMPVMVFSGLVLWFPVYLGSRLPEIGISVAYIAHSDEAILAFLAIVTWHLYNVHFNPDTFPMSPTFYTGTKSLEEMEREHPLELDDKPGGKQDT